ncbi:hypothetical protein ACHAWF_013771 [Thalassiosira exigua]
MIPSRGLILPPLLLLAAAADSAAPPPTAPRRRWLERRRRQRERRPHLAQAAEGAPRRLQGAFVGGSVYYDVNGNGARDPNEPPVPNAAVQIRNCNNALVTTTFASDLGEFSTFLPEAGCYYARLDVNTYQFTVNDGSGGSDVDPLTGRTDGVVLEGGTGAYWYAGILPDEASGITAMPTRSPLAPSRTPSLQPSLSFMPSGEPSHPTASPSASPTESVPPTACVIKEVGEERSVDASDAPVRGSSPGMFFSMSTPGGWGGEEGSRDEASGGQKVGQSEQAIRITSLTLRLFATFSSDTKYSVYYREGSYINLPRDNLTGWTLAASGDSLAADMVTKDEAVDLVGMPVETFLFRIPDDEFAPVEIPQRGGLISFYVTMENADVAYGDATEDEWDAIDVESTDLAEGGVEEDDASLRIHVGEAYPWTEWDALYSPRRFSGSVWYNEVKETPCHMHESYPSQMPSEVPIPPIPRDDWVAGIVGEKVEARFSVSVFLQQYIDDTTQMSPEVQDAFEDTLIEFLNKGLVFGSCVWIREADVVAQKLVEVLRRRNRRNLRGGAEGGNERHGTQMDRRGLQAKITILQTELLVSAVAHSDASVCPAGAVPITSNANLTEALANLGIERVAEDANGLGDRLQASHEYFDKVMTTDAGSNLLIVDDPEDQPGEQQVDEQPVADSGVERFPIVEEKGDNDAPSTSLVPIIAGVAAGVVLLCLLGGYYYYRWRKRRKKEEGAEEPSANEEPADAPEDGGTGADKAGKAGKADEEGKVAPGDGPTPEDEARAASKDEEPEEPDSVTLPLDSEEEAEDALVTAWPALRKVPPLEEVVMTRGLPRRRSEPDMATPCPALLTGRPKRTLSIGCLREVWINLHRPAAYGYDNDDGDAGFSDRLLKGELYPVDDPDVLYYERERVLRGEDANAPYVPHGADVRHNFIDEQELMRVESPPEAEEPTMKPEHDYGASWRKAAREAKAPIRAPKANPLVVQQVEMLEVKWKELREEYHEDVDSDDEDEQVNSFDVNARIEQLMRHIERLELRRKMRLAELKRRDNEDEELALKRMVKAGKGINYTEEFSKEFVIRKSEKKNKKNVRRWDVSVATMYAAPLPLDTFSMFHSLRFLLLPRAYVTSRKAYQDNSEDESSSEEESSEEEDGEYDVKWLRLKVPLAAQNPEAMRAMVEKGKELEK